MLLSFAIIIHFFESPRPSLAKGSFVLKSSRPSLPLKKSFFRIPPSPFSQRELHLSHQASLSSGTRGCNRPTRCSGPLRSKVGGPSKVYARLCGMGPLGDNSHQKLARLGGMGPLGDNSHQKLARLGGMGPHGDSRGVIPIIWHPPARCIPKPSRVL